MPIYKKVSNIQECQLWKEGTYNALDSKGVSFESGSRGRAFLLEVPHVCTWLVTILK